MTTVFHPFLNTRDDHLRFAWDLMKLRIEDPVINISHLKMPSWDRHLEFWKGSPYRVAYLIYAGINQDRAGMIVCTHYNEVGISIVPDFRHLGIATETLHWFLINHEPLEAIPGKRRGRFVANINPRNRPSKAFFESMGARLIQLTYELGREDAKTTH